MKSLPFILAIALSLSPGFADALEDFIQHGTRNHGDFGRRAAQFLVNHMPDQDKKSLTLEFLAENLDYAIKARNEFPWAKSVPEDLFFNDVLPYAVFDETRDPWRKEFYERSAKIVAQAKTATDAVQALNSQLFNLIKVHYNTGRKRPNQSPKESIALGMATCTGLSIILVDACRSVGIPARAVGTPLWSNGRGNHTWIEAWDGTWYFTGADEYDKTGLNRGWFVGDASQAKADVPRNAIYATSWRKDGLSFPMVWARNDQSVAAVNVTTRYAPNQSTQANPITSVLGVRLFAGNNGKPERMAVPFEVVDLSGRRITNGVTKAGTADLNDMPRVQLPHQFKGWIRFVHGRKIREIPVGPTAAGETTLDASWANTVEVSSKLLTLEKQLLNSHASKSGLEKSLKVVLTKSEVERAAQVLSAHWKEHVAKNRQTEIHSKAISLGDKTLRWLSKFEGSVPPDGRSLWISMHGGGNAPSAVNDRQWTNQLGLYSPPEGIYVAPRAPTDTWNLWHEAHIDPLFQRLIEGHVAIHGVNPNKVYLLGYSAGGDGVWQLAPRMADRFAAASMMAGHPNEATLDNLRNLPFGIFMGANDAAYNRNKVATDRGAELEKLHKADPQGYLSMVRIYEGMGHWMQKKDAEAIPWMQKHTRNPWPKKIVWRQDDVIHYRFYWLELPASEQPKAGDLVTATVLGNEIQIQGEPSRITLHLNDELVDLDQKIVVVWNGNKVFHGKVRRTAGSMARSLEFRADFGFLATVQIELLNPSKPAHTVKGKLPSKIASSFFKPKNGNAP